MAHVLLGESLLDCFSWHLGFANGRPERAAVRHATGVDITIKSESFLIRRLIFDVSSTCTKRAHDSQEITRCVVHWRPLHLDRNR